jgi:uracil-DNA glycosylase
VCRLHSRASAWTDLKSETVGVLNRYLPYLTVHNVAKSLSNPFGFDPDVEPFVPGYGDANAHFHVIGDNPGVHGGLESGIPFTDSESGETLQTVLQEAGLLSATGNPPDVDNTYLSYLLMGPIDGPDAEAVFKASEPLFDSELRAITAHVLIPVGVRATRHVFSIATAESPESVDMDTLHATEVVGSGWLVYPVKEPADWTDGDREDLLEALRTLQETDYRREADLGRFLPNDDPYLVR